MNIAQQRRRRRQAIGWAIVLASAAALALWALLNVRISPNVGVNTYISPDTVAAAIPDSAAATTRPTRRHKHDKPTRRPPQRSFLDEAIPSAPTHPHGHNYGHN